MNQKLYLLSHLQFVFQNNYCYNVFFITIVTFDFEQKNFIVVKFSKTFNNRLRKKFLFKLIDLIKLLLLILIVLKFVVFEIFKFSILIKIRIFVIVVIVALTF